MSCSGTSICTCGCCAGTSVQTPQPRNNQFGLTSISYRVGTWASFKESMLARLSSSDYPALSFLKTRDDGDFTIAFLDAAAIMLDILTFYQERLANESYLRTAGQLRSLTELCRLIGYQPSPGVSASAYLAFSLKTAPGQALNPSTTAITIPQGTQVQSVPAQGQTAQTFETSADILAKPDWNALSVQTGVPWTPNTGDTSVYLEGTATQLQPGDAILIVGDERLNSPSSLPSSEMWDLRLVTQVQTDPVNNRTLVMWTEGLGGDDGEPASQNPIFYALRQRAALFGYNAINPKLLASTTIANLQPNDSYWAAVLTWPGTVWNSTSSYSPGQIVTCGGNYYVCLVANTNQGPPNVPYWTGPPPVWNPTTTYTPNQIVKDNNANLYVCLLTNTGQGLPQVGSDSTYWTYYPYPWNPTAQYIPGQIVSFSQGAGGGFYVCMSANIGQEPPNSTDWTSAQSSPEDWNATTDYIPGEIVTSGGNFYVCLALNTSQGPPSMPYWTVAQTSSAPWNPTANYTPGQVVNSGGSYYLCTMANNNGQEPPNSTYWTPAQTWPGGWNATTNYTPGQVVNSGGNFYLCAVDNSNQEPPNTHYWTVAGIATDWNATTNYTPGQVVISGGNFYACLAANTNQVPPDIVLNISSTEWIFGVNNGIDLVSAGIVDLDAVYSKLATGGWLALVAPDNETSRSPAGLVSLYNIKSVTAITRSDYAISGKISRLATDSQANLSGYYGATRSTSALAQSEALPAAQQPLDHPLYGTQLELEGLRPDLAGIQVVALNGNSQNISFDPSPGPGSPSPALEFTPDDNSGMLTLNPRDLFTLIDPTPLPLNADGSIPDWSTFSTVLNLRVADASGRTGTIMGVQLSDFALALSGSSEPVVQEFALVSSVIAVATPFPHTRILLQNALVNCYDRTVTTVNANVGLATNGQSVSEIMGSGNASTPDQSFTLKQSPLTYVSAPTPTGRKSTLQVQANGVTWTEVPTLCDQGPSEQVFSTLNESDGTTDVLFGDGVEGALLPTGQSNIIANYRIGLGSAGNVGPTALTTLMDRPLGVSGVTNPEAATGGQDAQSVDDVRANAPLTVLTMGRAVSLIDYQNYASTFAGIAKAYALWIPGGPGQGVFLTVAAVDGTSLPPGSPTLTNLVTSLQNYGNPLIPITVQSFLETQFGFSADLKYDPAYDQPTVQAQVLQTVSQAYSFAERTFGQGVSVDEIATAIQGVPGVVAVNVTNLTVIATSAGGDLGSQAGAASLSRISRWRSMILETPLPRPGPGSGNQIYSYLPVASTTSLPQPAEILVLDPSSVIFGFMP
jgi:uncharacterized phage protein gp47/JayE